MTNFFKYSDYKNYFKHFLTYFNNCCGQVELAQYKRLDCTLSLLYLVADYRYFDEAYVGCNIQQYKV